MVALYEQPQLLSQFDFEDFSFRVKFFFTALNTLNKAKPTNKATKTYCMIKEVSILFKNLVYK